MNKCLKKSVKKYIKKYTSWLLAVSMMITCAFAGVDFTSIEAEAAEGNVTTATLESNALLDNLMNEYTSFILVRQRTMGGSHYAYTEALSDEMTNPEAPDGVEYNFFPGSQMVKIELSKNGNRITRKETVLIESNDGVLRDPDVSEDGTKVLFSWKKNSADDYHLYEYDLKTAETKQLTFGSGIADFEGKYLPDGKIVFSSTRIIQTVDCWKTPVSNIYTCDADGSNITRLGYDQVHTTYPTVTSDGRVIYTRWDYNDRNQMFVQGVLQMFPDGTNQTELFGNNSNFPTTLLHTREIPGASDKYISIATGHHTFQAGKLVVVDTSKGRNDEDAVEFVLKDQYTTKQDSVDGYGQEGALFKYPYAVNENLFLTAYCPSGWAGDKTYTPFGIYLFDMDGNQTELVPGDSNMPPSQIVPITNKTMFERASMVNYAKDTATYYVANVYEGEGLKGVEVGTAKYLRVVALDYRAYSIGATIGRGEGSSDPYSPVSTGNGSWDVKRVIGVTPIEEDGSALFTVPANTPIYFQILDADGSVIQSMRSWSTLMPGETFSCVGCHEDKNTVPTANSTTTIAMAKGVKELQPDVWQTGEGYEDYDPYTDSKGFDYLEEVQPILDESCIECHSDLEASYEKVGVSEMEGADATIKATPLAKDATWKYTTEEQSGDSWKQADFNDSSWAEGAAPFGTATSGPGQIGTVWNSDKIYMRTEFMLTKYQYQTLDLTMNLACMKAPRIYVNGELVYEATDSISSYTTIPVTNTMKKALKVGHNTIAITASKATDGNFVGLSIDAGFNDTENTDIVVPIGSQWKYRMSASNDVADGWNNINFDDSGWQTDTAPFGNRDGYVTAWGDNNKYIWLRKAFTINNLADYAGCTLILNTFYDDNPLFYLNGHLIYKDTSGNAWVDAYTNINLGSDFSEYLVEGTNVLAIQCSNDTGGQQIDCGLSLRKVKLSETELISTNSEWKYVMSTSDNVATEWNTVGFNDGSWNTGIAPFGDRENFETSWTGNNNYIWIRKSFTIENLSDFKNCAIKLNTFYDDNPQFYLNGHLIYTDTEGNPWVDGYTSVTLNTSYTQYLVEGENVLAIKCSNDTGGRQIDTSFSLVKGAVSTTELLPTGASGWKYVINSEPASDWMNENYNDSSWSTGDAPFGGGGDAKTSWTGDNSDIWLRKTFTVSNLDQIKDMKMYLNIFYDEDPTVYINGTKVYAATGYLTEYKMNGIPTEYTKLLKEGTNTIAIHAHNSVGGQFIDAGLSMKSVSQVPFSLESTEVLGTRMKKNFPISYLLLTGSYVSGTNWIASSTNEFTNWISSMSQCEVLTPYQYGSHNSELIQKLRNGHGNLTETQIRTIEAWIDLGVPAYGAYDTNNVWDGNAVRWAEQYTNKREFYVTMDEYAKANRAGTLEEKPITIEYDSSNGSDYSVTQSGLATLYVAKSYTEGDKVKIKLPEGEKYVVICLNSMMGEELIYVPNGEFTYTIPSATNVYPKTWKDAVTNTITARLPKDSELSEKRNLAQNIYDLDDATGVYPHATAKSAHNNQSEFQERNAIDGFTANTGHGDYPYQSWGPKNDDGYQWIQVDFGREVYASEVEVFIRADFPHDIHYISATLEFSDGSEQEVTMKRTEDAQKFTFDTVKTSYVKVKNLVPSDESTTLWEGIMELRVYGSVEEPKDPEPEEPEEPENPKDSDDSTNNQDNPTENPDNPTDNPDNPTDNPDDPTDNPDDPTNNPDDPTDNPDDPTDNPDDPTDNPDDSTENPDNPTDNPDDPTENPDNPIENPDTPTDNPDDPTDNPGGTTDPGENTTPGGTTDPGENTTPGGTTDPGENTNPGGTTNPGENKNPGGTTNPGESTNPGGTTNPGENKNSGGNTTPEGATDTTGLTNEEKQVVAELGIKAQSVKELTTLTEKYNGSTDTLLLTENYVKSLKSDGDVKGSIFSVLQAKASKQTKSYVKLKWNKVKDADGYLIYGNRCGNKNSYKLIKDLNKASKTSYTQKGLKKGTYYKYLVCAYKIVDNKKVTIVASKTIHTVTQGGNYGVAKSVKTKSANVKLKVGKTYDLSAKEIKADKKMKKHRGMCYETTNSEIATVSKKGKITAKKKGVCYVYAYAQNGVCRKIKVTIK